jgi:hypothetical protein
MTNYKGWMTDGQILLTKFEWEYYKKRYDRLSAETKRKIIVDNTKKLPHNYCVEDNDGKAPADNA